MNDGRGRPAAENGVERQASPDLEWKVLASRYVSREPWFTVRCDTVELPNGNGIPDYYVLEYPNWINVIALTPERKMVLVRQYRHGIGRVCWELVAGVCEKSDSSPLESAKRELAEETGFGGGEWKFFATLSANPGTHNNLTYTYLARNVVPVSERHLDPGEVLTVHLLDECKVLALLKRGEMLQSLMAAPLWKYFCEKA